MAESDENLGTLSSTLERLVSEVAGLRSELADLKRINTNVLQKHLVRKAHPKKRIIYGGIERNKKSIMRMCSRGLHLTVPRHQMISFRTIPLYYHIINL